MTCSVSIVGGNHRQDGTVGMSHSQEYSVRLTNGFNRRADVRLSIDGETLDVFRLRAFGSATIETKPNSGKRLTFYKLHTTEAEMGGVADNDATGLITAMFTPERTVGTVIHAVRSVHKPVAKGIVRCARSMSTASLGDSAGGTALSGHSSQQFVSAERMVLDFDAAVTIHLRLVCQGSDIQPLHSKVPSRPMY